jgi:hypothetical protein
MLFLKYTKTVSERAAMGFLLPIPPFLPLSMGRVFSVSPLFSISYGRLFRKASTVAPSVTPFFSITYDEIGGYYVRSMLHFSDKYFSLYFTQRKLWEVFGRFRMYKFVKIFQNSNALYHLALRSRATDGCAPTLGPRGSPVPGFDSRNLL